MKVLNPLSILNSNKDITDIKHSMVTDEMVKSKLSKNIEDLISNLKILTTECNDNKEFFKNLFKMIDSMFSYIDDDTIMSMSNIIDIPIANKVALFLKYREVSNYKERIKMIKDICKDVDISDILNYENYIESEMNFIGRDNNVIGNIDIYENIERDLFITHLTIYHNILLLMKCVLFDYHRKEIMYFEDGKPKFKIVQVKNIYLIGSLFKLGSKINIQAMMELFLQYELDKNEVCSIDMNLTLILLSAYLNNKLKYDEYNKLLLDKNYNNLISNRLTKFIDTNCASISNIIFMKRKVLTPKNGVIILPEDTNSYIESVLLKEIKMCTGNHICFITRYKDGTEIANNILVNDKFYYNPIIFGSKLEFNNSYYNTLSYILHFLEVGALIPDGVSLNYTVISPSYWKYRKNGYVSSNDKINKLGVVIKREFDIEIAPFLRKINGTPSNEAIKLSKELGVILEDGYTIVKPHIRTYNKVK